MADEEKDRAIFKIGSNLFTKLVASCLTIITTCLTTILVFIWNAHAEYARQRAIDEIRYQNTRGAINEIANTVSQMGTSINEVKENSARMDERMKNLENKRP